MPWITVKYLDLKIVDGSAPSKKRVVFFDRRTDTKLLTIPAAEISNEGILETTLLDPALPDHSIYAIVFDDEGNRQLAGADKLSIKTKLIWVDKALAYHVEFYPGESTNERVSGAPLILTEKPVEQDFKQGVLTTFDATTPTINEYGLLVHQQQSNICKMTIPNDSFCVLNVTQTQTTFKDLPMLQVREIYTNAEHGFKMSLDSFGTNTSSVNRLFKFSGYFKVPSGGLARKLKVSVMNASLGVVYSAVVDLINKTVTHGTANNSLSGSPAGEVFRDPRFPEFYCLNFVCTIPANAQIWLLSFNLMPYSDSLTYLGDLNSGIDIWNFYMSDISTFADLSLPNLFNPTTTKLNLISTGNKYNYNPPSLSTILNTLSDYSNPPGTIMLDMIVMPRFGKNDLIKMHGDKNHSFVGGLLSITSAHEWLLVIYRAVKEPSNIRVMLNWSAMDIIRVRAFGDKTVNIPDDVKAHYGITDSSFPVSCVVVIYENITKGTRMIAKDGFAYAGCDRTTVSKVAYDNLSSDGIDGIKRGSYHLQKLQIWTKPLPEDWVKL